jgi:hypothetical protein|tara:strand:- start:1268 stop:1825 length:558 start_codon:yes stop_codon:yes gene_type:complete
MKLNRRQLRRLIESTILEQEGGSTSGSDRSGAERDDAYDRPSTFRDPYGNKDVNVGALENKEGAILNAVNAELKRANLFDEKTNVFANPAPGAIRSSHFHEEYIAADIEIGPIKAGDQETNNDIVLDVITALGSDEAMERMKRHNDVVRNKVGHVFTNQNFRITSEQGGTAFDPSVVISLRNVNK